MGVKEQMDNWLTGDEKITLYHASLSKNVPSIQERGIVTRTDEYCNKLIDDILAEFGLTRYQVPKSRWQYGLNRCLESTRKVYLTTERLYAIQNCRAGLEAENMARDRIKAFKQRKGVARAIKDRVQWIKDNPCSVCSFEVTLDELSELEYEASDEWERKRHTLEEYKERQKARIAAGIKSCHEFNEKWGDKMECSISASLGTVVLNHMPPNTPRCEAVPFEEDIELRYYLPPTPVEAI